MNTNNNNINTSNYLFFNSNNFNNNINSENTLFFESPLLRNKIESDKNNNEFLNINNTKVATSNDTKNELIQLISFLNSSGDYKPTLNSSNVYPNMINQNINNNLNVNSNINKMPSNLYNLNNNSNEIENNILTTNLINNKLPVNNIIEIESKIKDTVNINNNMNFTNQNDDFKKNLIPNKNEIAIINHVINNDENSIENNNNNLIDNIFPINNKNLIINSDFNNKLTFSQNSNSFKDSQQFFSKDTKTGKQNNLFKNNFINDYLKRNHVKSSSFSYRNFDYNYDNNYKRTHNFINNKKLEINNVKDSKSFNVDNKISGEIINLQDLIQLKEKISTKNNMQTNYLDMNNNQDFNYKLNYYNKFTSENQKNENLKVNFIGDNDKNLIRNAISNKQNITKETRDGSAEIKLRNKYKNLLEKFSNNLQKMN